MQNYNVQCDPNTGLCTAELKISLRRAYAVPANRAAGVAARGIPALPAPLVQARGEGAYLGYGLNVRTRAVDEKKRTILFVASTETEDRMGDIIRQSGWKLEEYRRNPVGLWCHDSAGWTAKGGMPVCRGIRTAVERGELHWLAQFPTEAEYEFGALVFRMAANGYLNAVSVGFIPIKFSFLDGGSGIEFTEQTLIEISIVPVPANPDALISDSLLGKFAPAVRAVEIEDSLNFEVRADRRAWTRAAFREWLEDAGLSRKLAPANANRDHHIAPQAEASAKLPDTPEGIAFYRGGKPVVKEPSTTCPCERKAAEPEKDELLDLLLKAPAPPPAKADDVVEMLLRDETAWQQQRLEAERRANALLNLVSGDS